MTSGNKVELHIPSVLGSEKVAMERAAAVAREMGFSEDRVEDLKTAVAEACINAIEHGSGGNEAARVGVTLTVEDSRLMVDIHDRGKGIGEVQTPSIEGKIAGEASGRGWGIFLIRGLMDEVRFEKKPEGGNVVKMIIYLEPKRKRGQNSAPAG